MKNQNNLVYVVGAGISGLACAQYLKKYGVDVVVLEARDRLGGRIHSIESQHMIFDLGASWIHGIQYNPIWDLAQKNNIQTEVYNYDKIDYFHEDGSRFSDEELIEFEKNLKSINGRFKDQSFVHSSNQSALDVFDEIVKSIDLSTDYFSKDQHIKKLRDYFFSLANDPFATDINQLAHNFMQFEGYFEGDEVVFPNGYQQVIDVLSEGLDCRLNIEVTEIINNDSSIQIRSACGQTFDSTQVVVSVPLGVLKNSHIQFIPPLNHELQHSIENIGFGSFNKVFIELDRALTFKGTYFKENFVFFWRNEHLYSLLDFSHIYHKPVYLLFFGGCRSEWLDQANDSEVMEHVKSILDLNTQNSNANILQFQITRWGSDPFAKGSFSYPAIGHNEAWVDQFTNSHPKNVYFAGEHCHSKYAGTVHGAYLSGIETARRILMMQNQ